LVLWGEQDGIVPISYGRRYANAFPNASFQPIANAGHMPNIEQPGAVLAAVEEFIDSDLLSPVAD
jgi:pimeloyl-ACP methyl ester carboxylesterase